MGQPKLYLFVGYPGSGKTTVAHIIHEATGAIHLWADHERQAMFNDVSHSKQESEELYDYLNQRTETLLKSGKDVIFDTNFNYAKDREYLRGIARKHNAQTLIIWMQTPVAVARERALHEQHRDRNGYEQAMSAQDFERLINHVEPPTDHENFIIIDGTDVDINDVRRKLNL